MGPLGGAEGGKSPHSSHEGGTLGESSPRSTWGRGLRGVHPLFKADDGGRLLPPHPRGGFICDVYFFYSVSVFFLASEVSGALRFPPGRGVIWGEGPAPSSRALPRGKAGTRPGGRVSSLSPRPPPRARSAWGETASFRPPHVAADGRVGVPKASPKKNPSRVAGPSPD